MACDDPVSDNPCHDGWPSIDDARPVDEGGTIARNGFSFQDHVAVSFLIEMLKDPTLVKIHFETHDDLVLVKVIDNVTVAEFVQVKGGNAGSMWSLSDLCRKRGTKSLFEASLERDRYCETSRFRVVTSGDVRSELHVLTFERYCPARAPSDLRMRTILDYIDKNLPGTLSRNGNTAGYWIQHCLWDVRHDLPSLLAKNFVSLLELSEHEGHGLIPSGAKMLLAELLRYAEAASNARWAPHPSAKVITRDWLRSWWDQRKIQILHSAPPRATGAQHHLEPRQFSHRDIYLDVFNADYHKIFAWDALFSAEQQAANLVEILTIAIFLCRDRCIMPPRFVLESPSIRQTIELTRPFFEAALVQWPMREADPRDFWKKKIGKMIGARKDYPHMLDQDAVKQLYTFPGSRDPSKPQVGIAVARRWLEAPDTQGVWDDMKRDLPTDIVDAVRYIPSRLVENAKGVTLSGVAKYLPGVRKHSNVLLRELAKSYSGVYLAALDVAVLSGVPNCGDDLGLGSGDMFYDVRALRAALHPLGLWPLHQLFSPEEIVDLRSTDGYGQFITAYIAATALKPYDIRKRFAQAAKATTGRAFRDAPPISPARSVGLLARRIGKQPSKLVRDAADWLGQVADNVLR